MPLSNATFFRFAVRLPEKGDLRAMSKLLTKYAEHRDELLNGLRKGSDGYTYGALVYASWLANFDDHRSARDVAEWLIREGAQPDIWTYIGLEDEPAFLAELDAKADWVHEPHPMWGSPMLEAVPEAWRPHLLSRGAVVSDVFSALVLGDLDRARELIDADPSLLETARKTGDGATVLQHALCNQHDDFALELLDRGAANEPDTTGQTPLLMAVVWGNERTLAQLIEDGANLSIRPWKKSLVGYVVDSPAPSASVLRTLLAAGVDASEDRFDVGDIVARAEQRNLPELATIMRAHGLGVHTGKD
ncbi:MAG: ankyrin repeat domain-containing protein [Proteobacteria bacterium]|nr:ankyrin repeat domain-containing protein [Pseudomonadota bacterium]